MNNSTHLEILNYLNKSIDILSEVSHNSAGLVARIDASIDLICEVLYSGNKILLCGNGGSAADAQHLAAEFVGRFEYDRPPIAAIALTTDSSVLTAVANDYTYDQVFSRQILTLGHFGDVLIAISTSGSSLNILRAIEAAKSKGMKVIGLTGNRKEQIVPMCDICLEVPSNETPLIQQVHITIGHIICKLVEQRMFPIKLGEAVAPLPEAYRQ